jgi:acyl transferase domain-containing protein/acyl carrier protein
MPTRMTQDPGTSDHSALLKRSLDTISALEERLAGQERARREPLAIVGVGVRLPGDVNTAADFWRLLREGKDAITEVPRERWDAERFFDPDPDRPGKMCTRWGGFLSRLDEFDARFFGIAPREAAAMDPQQRLLLEVGWEALEQAGYAVPDDRNRRTGVFVGMVGVDYSEMRRGDLAMLDGHLGTGTARSIAAGRLSYAFGLRGPNMAVDTACSSSAVATHLACQSLRAGECDVALAGGVNLTLVPEGFIIASRGRMLSPTGRCHTFDAAADGYVRAEGCVLFVLKRLSDAVAADDEILAVILGSAINQDGRSNGMTAPNGLAQEDLLRAAIADAGVAPEEIGYIEAHGTGTPLGDPIELGALARMFGQSHSREHPLRLGSVKTNIGHLEGAAGAAGMLKLALALRHGELPPHLHLQELNPHIHWQALPFEVPTALTPWRVASGARRIGGVSSFGFSGTNSHIILAEPPDRAARTSAVRPRLVSLSAKNSEALGALASRIAAGVGDGSRTLADVAVSLNVGRTHWNERMAVVASDIDEFVTRLRTVAEAGASATQRGRSAGAPEIAFLFTGQGAQWPGMGQGLYDCAPDFRAVLDRCAAGIDAARTHYVAAGMGGGAARDVRPLLEVMFAAVESPAAAMLDQTGYTQPALFALEYALASQWQAWGIRPSVLIGHSVGELVAATVAGVIPLDDALRLVTARGLLLQGLPADGPLSGGMASVTASEAEVRAVLDAQPGVIRDAIDIAAVNSPTRVVISGAAAPLASATSALLAAGCLVQPLRVSHAFHSPLVEPVLDAFERIAAEISFGPATIPVVSNVTGMLAGAELGTAEYWTQHIRRAVRFAAGMSSVRQLGCTVCVEIGPRPTLLGLAAELETPPALSLPSLRPGQDELRQMLESLAALYVHGANVDWHALERNSGGRRLALPTYPFQRQRYWLPFPDIPQNGGALRRSVEHPLLHERLRSPRLAATVFQSELGAQQPAYLGGHRIHDLPLFPAAAYLEMAWATARRITGANAAIEQLQIHEPMVLSETGAQLVQLIVEQDGEGRLRFEVCSAPAGEGRWPVHATGWFRPSEVRTAAGSDTLDDVRSRCTDEYSVELFYDRLAADGANYSGAFRSVAEIWRSNGEALGRVELPRDTADDPGSYEFHPAMLDACLQLIGAAHPAAVSDAEVDLYVPVELNQCMLERPGAGAVWCHASIPDPASDNQTLAATLRWFAADGSRLGEIGTVVLRRVSAEMRAGLREGMPAARLNDWLYSLDWEALAPADESPSAVEGRWLVIGNGPGVGADLVQRLRAEGADAVHVAIGSDVAESRTSIARALDEGGREGRPLSGVVHLSALDLPTEADSDPHLAQQTSCGALLSLVQELAARDASGCALWIVTRGAQFVRGRQATTAPMQSPLWGLANTISVEHPELGCRCIDLDPGAGPEPAALLMAEFASAGVENRLAVRSGRRFAARFERLPMRADEAGAGQSAIELEITERGMLDKLVVRPAARGTPGAGEVEISVRATGLNFRDVLNALGMYPGPAGPLGNECAGVITAVGPGVTSVAVGEDVVALGSGTFRSHVITRATSVYPKPSSLTHAEAATLPITFLTAYYGLHTLAGLKAGDRVLVHAAAGGVGLAAVQLALRAGAEVIGSAGSPQKVAYLRSLGVRHVINSRDPESVRDVMQLTAGRGVDIVLNSLADEFIPRSLEVLSDGGCFLEIGKRGVWTPEQVHELNPTLRYHVYDLADIVVPEPEYMARVFDELVPEFECGSLWPLPLQVFPFAEAGEAFRFMAQARHTGKIVVVQETSEAAADVRVRGDGSYLITGGLGGLGLVMARWLADRGARHIALLGRRAPGQEALAVIAALESAGVKVQVMAADIGCAADVQRVFETLKSSMPPLRGIIHSAGVLDDGVLVQQSMERFGTVMRAKVAGAWNLHACSRALSLDFLLLFSTGSVYLGAAGQGNYAAANAYLDGLAHYRRAVGLPATAINWGPWSGVGMAAGLSERDHRRWEAAGLGLIAPEEGVRAMEQLLRRDPVQTAVLPFDWKKQSRMNGRTPRILVRLSQAAATPAARVNGGMGGGSAVLEQLRSADPGEAREQLWIYVRDLVVKVLALDPRNRLDPTLGLTDLGMDSLMAVELSNHLQASLGVKLSSTLAFEHPTLGALAEFLARNVLPPVATNGGMPPSGATPPVVAPAAPVLSPELAAASDAEIEATLLRELSRAGY